jgi:hypothetical protein
LLLVPEIIRHEDAMSVLPGQNEVRPFALELGCEEEMRVRNGDDSGIRLHSNRRYAIVTVEGFTPCVNHNLTLSGRFTEAATSLQRV